MAHAVDRTVLNGYSKLVEENIDMDIPKQRYIIGRIRGR